MSMLLACFMASGSFIISCAFCICSALMFGMPGIAGAEVGVDAGAEAGPADLSGEIVKKYVGCICSRRHPLSWLLSY